MPELGEIRDRYDRANVAEGAGVVLIGLPGIEKRLAPYPQLASRVGFVHHFRLVQRLFAKIARVLEINRLGTIAAEVVETARESLVIGP